MAAHTKLQINYIPKNLWKICSQLLKMVLLYPLFLKFVVHFITVTFYLPVVFVVDAFEPYVFSHSVAT